ncbi:Abc transporter b family member [Thalictrum thalictroides]|uniref:Abc transporter b family member n=1 Tax=Thalictrum thalictroides TaxID=46969 RepID=A0A7J6VHX5_THATH|nr:Abc transporter b family member [Thalictrum thalictroides]
MKLCSVFIGGKEDLHGMAMTDQTEKERYDEHDDEKNTEKTKGREGSNKSLPLYKLFSFPDAVDIILMFIGAIAALGNGLCVPLMAYFVGQLVDSFGKNARSTNLVDEVSKVCLNYVYLGIGSAAASFLQMACWMVTGERQSARIRNMYLKTILRQDITFFDKETNTAEVVGRMSGDVVLIQDAMGEKVGKSFQLTATFIGGFVVAFNKGWLLVLVLMSTVPFLVLCGASMSITVNKLAARGQEAYAEAGAIVEQTICTIRTVASFTGERQAIDKYDKSLNKAYEASVMEGLASGIGLGMVMFIVFCSYGLSSWFGALMIIQKGYTGGDVVCVMMAVVSSSMSLGELSPCMKAFAAGQAAAFNMFETIERKPDIDSFDSGGRTLDNLRGDIELKDIHFSYPTRPQQKIFSGFSLSIPSGTITALIGESGSGKSTVISLLERFYDPQAGEVLIDGINLKEFQLRWLRGKIGLVSQEPVLFASSIKDNIAYGKDNPSLEEIRSAAELANASIFIDKLPEGLETMVGDYGTQLSGGQKQRVAIARAILRDPRILLLDEATSALDAESEQIVQEALDRIMINRTTVIIAHRLSTVRNSDTIALIGESGCGKSTVISLLQRFYDLDSGQILLDGTDIRKFQLKLLRKQMGLVSQEPILFNETIRANIAYGKEGATEAEILGAAEAANAHKFISGMQQGYDTLVGERGVQLSGGQKQRVAIARAILKCPKILLLDEATSALDSESERVVQDALNNIMVNRTTIVVAHRLSTIKGADSIAVLKNGAIIEKGRHADLLNIKDGVYSSLLALHMASSSG